MAPLDLPLAPSPPPGTAARESIRVRGTVQGVGFRPHVWRIASELGIGGSVVNDGQGVLIDAAADRQRIDRLVERLRSEAPPLARVESIERAAVEPTRPAPSDFVIGSSHEGLVTTAVAADAATCADCLAEILDPAGRRFRYPLTNCTRCGPRLSFITGLPFDRPQTTMAAWPMCADCRAEYDDPSDRRFHAQAIACPTCGPIVSLRRLDGAALVPESLAAIDACDAAGVLLERGCVLAIKGLGGYQLACDSTQAPAVARLRELKRREAKPFALLAADLAMVRRYCEVCAAEEQALDSPAAPIVLLLRRQGAAQQAPIADAVAPGLARLGFMLPSTGITHLLMRRIGRPVVLTSGNLSDEPQAITLAELAARFPGGIDGVLDHERPIARRIDDSVVGIADGRARVWRRARGFAPQPIALPAGFADAPPVLAYGPELKNTVCLLRDGQAVLSQHIGELSDAATLADYRRAVDDLQGFFRFTPHIRACDAHPGYPSTRIAQQQAGADGSSVVEVLHHHAHLASCLVDNGRPLDAPAVIGVALDGLGYGFGPSGAAEWWGGEFAIVDYRRFERRACFKPVALIGGDAAAREPWRNTYAHLMAAMTWPDFARDHAPLELQRFLAAKPRALLDQMLARQVNTPLASSCGRLFDAVAAAIGICRDHAAYEGRAAIELEAMVDRKVLASGADADAYPFGIVTPHDGGVDFIEPRPMWRALLDDLRREQAPGAIAARFHSGLASAIVRMVTRIADAAAGPAPLREVALSGGVFQNRVLLEGVAAGLRAAGFTVLSQRRIPCNDGGLALGQAAVAAALALRARSRQEK